MIFQSFRIKYAGRVDRGETNEEKFEHSLKNWEGGRTNCHIRTANCTLLMYMTARFLVLHPALQKHSLGTA